MNIGHEFFRRKKDRGAPDTVAARIMSQPVLSDVIGIPGPSGRLPAPRFHRSLARSSSGAAGARPLPPSQKRLCVHGSCYDCAGRGLPLATRASHFMARLGPQGRSR